MSNVPFLQEKKISNGWFVLLFTVITIVLVISNWPIISMHNIEVSDFAANSLLIQEAKRFSLFVGNYSRVGFNHPGPAILYVMAFGEFLFHDTLQIVSSPFSGQLLAVALYSAFWITLILKLLTKLTGKFFDASLITALFLTAITFLDYPFLTGMWFPNLYMLPFTVMIISISTLLNGRSDALQYLALSSGFLINGHVSFVAILGITLILVLAFNRIVFYKAHPAKVITKKDYILNNKRAILFSIGTLALFFVPLIIETIIHFPGPIAAYAAFSGGHAPNTLSEAIKFTSIYWGGIVPGVIGTAALVFTNTKLPNAKSHWIRAICLTFISVTCAFLFYAKYGVDMLDQTYIGFFYFSVPALTLAILVFICRDLLPENKKRIASLFTITACIAITFHSICKPPTYANLYNQQSITEIYNALTEFNYPKRMVLDLDNGKNWGYIWSDILGIEIYAARNNNPLFCIKKNWHISFTREAMCTPSEVENNRRFYVTRNTQETSGAENIVINTPRLLFTEMTPPSIVEKGLLELNGNQELFNRYILDTGWSAAEQDFAWSMSKIVTISIPVPTGFKGQVTLDLGAFAPTPKTMQHIQISYDNQVLATREFNNSNTRQKISFDVNAGEHKIVYLTITVKHPISPKELGLSDDQRKLGVALYGIQVREE